MLIITIERKERDFVFNKKKLYFFFVKHYAQAAFTTIHDNITDAPPADSRRCVFTYF
jgi:hypothetical protein